MPLVVASAWLGSLPYHEAEKLQAALVEAVAASAGQSGYLLALEHPPAITLGRSYSPAHLRTSSERLQSIGVEVYHSRRGGSVTYHGPGQVVLYPILPLWRLRRDVRWYLRMLEDAGIRTLADYGISAGRISGLTGVWAASGKVMAIGVAVRRWTTFHGAALNVSAAALAGFRWIVPCGIEGKGVASIETLTGRAPPLPEVAAAYAGHLAAVLGFNIIAWPAHDGFARRLGEEAWQALSRHGSPSGCLPAGR